jgi:hypothetical protein
VQVELPQIVQRKEATSPTRFTCYGLQISLFLHFAAGTDWVRASGRIGGADTVQARP